MRGRWWDGEWWFACFKIFLKGCLNWSQENLNQLPHRAVQHGREATTTARSGLFPFAEEIALGLGEVNG